MKTWITRDGVKLQLRDMTDTHLTNAIQMLDRRIETLHDELCACFSFPSDSMASYYAEGSADEVSRKLSDVRDARHALQQERLRRTR